MGLAAVLGSIPIAPRVKDDVEPAVHDTLHAGPDSRRQFAVVKQDAQLLTGPPAGSVHISRTEHGKLVIDYGQLEVRVDRLLAPISPRHQRLLLVLVWFCADAGTKGQNGELPRTRAGGLDVYIPAPTIA